MAVEILKNLDSKTKEKAVNYMKGNDKLAKLLPEDSEAVEVTIDEEPTSIDWKEACKMVKSHYDERSAEDKVKFLSDLVSNGDNVHVSDNSQESAESEYTA